MIMSAGVRAGSQKCAGLAATLAATLEIIYGGMGAPTPLNATGLRRHRPRLLQNPKTSVLFGNAQEGTRAGHDRAGLSTNIRRSRPLRWAYVS
jgi:hypothetical protein